MEKGYASSVYHMSARRIQRETCADLWQNMIYSSKQDKLFQPDWRELKLAEYSLSNSETAYAKWPMGNEGFVTSSKPDEAMKAASKYGLEARIVGVVEEGERRQTGVSLAE